MNFEDGCPMEEYILSSEHNSSIVWLEANIGEMVTRSCPCGVLESSTYFNNSATRVCSGTYTFGGSWEEPDTGSCDYNRQNLNITLELCQITTVAMAMRYI